MPSFKIIITACLAVAIFSCKTPSTLPHTKHGGIKFIKNEGSTITLTTQHYNSQLNDAIASAEINLIENLLYTGVPNSNHEKPLIRDKGYALDCCALVLDEFIYKGGYKEYLMESNVLNKSFSNSLHWVEIEATFNMDGIRLFLENKNLIRKFGL